MPSSTPPIGDIGPWRGLVRVQGAVRRELDAALKAAEGISTWDYTVLRTLADAPKAGLRMTELARSTDYTPSGLTRLVERLERRGLIERRPSAEDRRGFVAALTPEGRTAFRRARKAHLAQINRCFLDRCTPQERAVLSRLWERLLPGSTT